MVFAHGIGGAKDLPIPAEYAMAGAGAALAVSFIVLALAWRTPRFDAATHGRPAPAWLASLVDSTAFAVALRVLGFAFFAYVVWAALAGPDLLLNPTFGVVYVLLWVGLVPMSLLFGPFYKAVSPMRTIHLAFTRLTGGRPDDGIAKLPAWVGLWPAAIGLLAFVWLELVYPGSTYLSPVRLWFAAYIAIAIVGAAVFGSEWLEKADPFEVYSTLVGHLSIFGRTADGTLVLRSPLGNLDGVPPWPGLVGVVSVLFGSTAFDSFKDSNEWLRFTQSVSVSSTLLDFVALLVFCAVVGVTFSRWPPAWRRGSAAVPSPTGSPTRWCRSSWATSWRTTSATSSRSASRRWCSCRTRSARAGTCSARPTGRSPTGSPRTRRSWRSSRCCRW